MGPAVVEAEARADDEIRDRSRRPHRPRVRERGDPRSDVDREPRDVRPAHLDLTLIDGPMKGQTILLIYSVEGDVLKLALTSGNLGVRPTEFKMGQGSNLRILILKRESK